jgi:hypothetical protein
MNHELGLHHDCDFSKLFNEGNDEFLKRDIAVFENVINKKISGISSHEPNRSIRLIGDKDLARFGLKYQAYSDIFLKEMKYISDSSCQWREGCMCNFIKQGTQRLCILTHPIWWSNRSSLENY